MEIGLRQIYRAGYEYKKAGVIVTGILPAGQVQADMFGTINHEKQGRVAGATDQLNRLCGRNTIIFAVPCRAQPGNSRGKPILTSAALLSQPVGTNCQGLKQTENGAY